ncbi:cytochrome c maturation protein CcmE [Nocardioides sp.]|uniref:cytochrome c maturation protein CcmE n=1 Tax=Nocardioides sp. TaxID=35761 RepID=UPI00260E1654|nr:cytochrome c maturation protein CcmE [Nocardioides sp.]MDI6909835.1 cytochrome c maturation protein CcmE [Nocardioides sp.]
MSTTTAPDPTHGPDAVPPPARRGSARLRVIVCVAIILAALGWIAVRGLTGSFVYYLTPSEVVNGGQAEISQRIRLGGYVEPGSVTRDDQGLTFTVSDGEESIRVVSTGSVPQLFRAGQGVVLEGALGADRLFHADTLLVKHDGEYRAPDPTKGS